MRKLFIIILITMITIASAVACESQRELTKMQFGSLDNILDEAEIATDKKLKVGEFLETMERGMQRARIDLEQTEDKEDEYKPFYPIPFPYTDFDGRPL